MKAHFILSKEIALQKLRKSPDKSMIQSLQQMYNKLEISFADFINTGRIMTTSYYKKEFGEIELDDKCENVCRYMGGFVVQNFSNGKWAFNYATTTNSMFFESTNLKDVEHFMWEKVINN